MLKGLAELLPRRSPNPFPVISGTSAGAINTVVLATRARLFRHAVADLERVWANFRTEQVFRADCRHHAQEQSALAGGPGCWAAWVSATRGPCWTTSRWRNLLARNIRFDGIAESIERGYVDAMAVTAAGYDSAAF